MLGKSGLLRGVVAHKTSSAPKMVPSPKEISPPRRTKKEKDDPVSTQTREGRPSQGGRDPARGKVDTLFLIQAGTFLRYAYRALKSTKGTVHPLPWTKGR